MSLSLTEIQAIAFDVDGVLTDGSMLWGPAGEEWKRFHFADIMAISLARRAGIPMALISGENSPLVTRYAEKMHIAHVFKGVREKAGALQQFGLAIGQEPASMCFVGDDLNDLPAMRIAGFSVAPANACKEVLAFASFTCQHAGGNGAVREFIDALLAARNLDPEALFKIRL